MKRFAFKKETHSPNGIEWKDGNYKRTNTKQILIILVCLCFVCVGGVQAVMPSVSSQNLLENNQNLLQRISQICQIK